MTAAMAPCDIVQRFAEHGYLIEPDFLDFVVCMDVKAVPRLIQEIDRKAPQTLVADFRTLAEVTGDWILIIRAPEKRRMWFLKWDTPSMELPQLPGSSHQPRKDGVIS